MRDVPEILSSRRATRRTVMAAMPLAGLAAAGWRPAGVLAQATPAAPFPVTIEHAFGATEVLGEPSRVMTIGFSEQDPVLAAGVTPIAVREWFGGKPFAAWPWTAEALGDGEPEVLDMPYGEIDFERVIGITPDLIVATHSGITQEEYDRLSEIAPTVAQSGDYPPFGMPWQEQARVIGRALGRDPLAEEQIAATEQQIVSTAGAHPEFAGVDLVWINPNEDGTWYVVGPTTPPMRFFAALGFTYPAELGEQVGDEDSINLSAEQLHLADTGVLVSRANNDDHRATMLEDSVFGKLDVVQDDRAIIFSGDDPIYAALSFSTVLSLPYALEQLKETLAEAAGRL